MGKTTNTYCQFSPLNLYCKESVNEIPSPCPVRFLWSKKTKV